LCGPRDWGAANALDFAIDLLAKLAKLRSEIIENWPEQ